MFHELNELGRRGKLGKIERRIKGPGLTVGPLERKIDFPMTRHIKIYTFRLRAYRNQKRCDVTTVLSHIV
jgi:hypothetical protein